jgi:hypothetical protein
VGEISIPLIRLPKLGSTYSLPAMKQLAILQEAEMRDMIIGNELVAYSTSSTEGVQR